MLWSPTGYYGPWGARFVDFGKAIKLGEAALVGYSFLYFLVTESSSLFYVLECLYKFVFDFGGGVLVENSVGVGVHWSEPKQSK